MFNTFLFPEFEDFREIGHGGFGRVYSARHQSTGKMIAIKVISRISVLASREKQFFNREIDTLASIDHPFLCQFYGMLEDEQSYYIVMEYLSGGTLINYLHTMQGTCNMQIISKMFCQIMSAVRYLHNVKHIVHRDLKYDNILLDENKNIRIIDFGLCSTLKNPTDLLRTQCGSTYFVAPEILKGKSYSTEVDIWSVGVNLFAMCFNSLPFYSSNSMQIAKLIVNTEPKFPINAREDLKDLLTNMLNKNPAERITADEIAQHPFVKSTRYSQFLTDDFIKSNRYRIIPSTENELDAEIITQMKNLKIPTDDLFQHISNINSNEIIKDVFFYKFFRKTKITAFMASPSELRHNFQMTQMNRTRVKIGSPCLFSPSMAKTGQSKVTIVKLDKNISPSKRKSHATLSVPPKLTFAPVVQLSGDF